MKSTDIKMGTIVKKVAWIGVGFNSNSEQWSHPFFFKKKKQGHNLYLSSMQLQTVEITNPNVYSVPDTDSEPESDVETSILHFASK